MVAEDLTADLLGKGRYYRENSECECGGCTFDIELVPLAEGGSFYDVELQFEVCTCQDEQRFDISCILDEDGQSLQCTEKGQGLGCLWETGTYFRRL